MGGKAPKAPPAPDPFATAAAQTGSNVATAMANTFLGNANEYGPLGSVQYKQQTKKVAVKDPKTGKVVIDPKTGKPQMKSQALTRTVTDASGRTYQIPMFDRITKLDPAQQKLLNQQNQIGSELNDLSLSQARRLGAHLSTPMNLEGLPEQASSLGPYDEGYRGRVESALMERMNPQLSRDYNELENRLVNQGFARDSEAFRQAMDEHGRKSNDARTQIFLASGNEARAQSGEMRNVAQFNSDLRKRALEERAFVRNQPINEITALMAGGQVSMPQFSAYNPGTVANTPVGDYIYKTADLQRQDANRAATERGNLFNTLGNVAGAGIFKWSDARLKTDIEYVGTDQTTGIRWYTYRYIGSAIQQVGVMAQEVMLIRPDAVVLTPTGFYAVDYARL